MRLALTAVIGAVLLTLPGLTTAAGAQTGVAAPGSPQCPYGGGADFDGVDGAADIAFGAAGATVAKVKDAGQVEVQFGCGVLRNAQELRLPHPHTGDRFGAALLDAQQGSVGGNGKDDLVVGIPDYDVGSAKDAGAIAVFAGSSKGLSSKPTIITQATKGVAGTAQAGAHFGASLSAYADFDSNTQLIRVGEPGKTVDGHKNAGGFVELHLKFSADHHHTVFTSSSQYTLDNAGVSGAKAQTGDEMGASLFENSVVGLPAAPSTARPKPAPPCSGSARTRSWSLRTRSA